MARIAVEQTLSDVQQALQNSGHDVVALNESSASDCQCCVISGQDKDMMGMADTMTKASVINAEGMTADEVVQQVNSSINR